MNLIKPTIPITVAESWAYQWQTHNPNHAKAFLIPIEDVLETLKEMNVLQEIPGQDTYVINNIQDANLRAYMAIDNTVPASVGSQEKLLIVGTAINAAGEHCDIIEGGTYPTSGIKLVGSGVFDFTLPCPNHCDPKSPLFNPGK